MVEKYALFNFVFYLFTKPKKRNHVNKKGLGVKMNRQRKTEKLLNSE